MIAQAWHHRAVWDAVRSDGGTCRDRDGGAHGAVVLPGSVERNGQSCGGFELGDGIEVCGARFGPHSCSFSARASMPAHIPSHATLHRLLAAIWPRFHVLCVDTAADR